MVVNVHNFSFFEIEVYGNGCIAHQLFNDSQKMHHAHRKSNIAQSITFIKMKSTLHNNHFFSFQSTKNQFSFVEFYGCSWEIGDVIVAYFSFNFYILYYFSKSGSQNYTYFGIFKSALF